MSAKLQQTLEALYGLERRKDKLGLEGTRALLAALGDPHLRFRSVHVAGTNGKGSVCALVERVLREAGYHTGLYTSPHLVDFRERIRVNGRWVDEHWLEDALERIVSLPEGRDRTFFEVATALGFLYFAEQQVEIAVVEVGLGGRLDCTNVITPEVSVITTIGLDHTEILGDTLAKIAVEKAGIIKPGIPVVPPKSNKEVEDLIRAIARERGAPTIWEVFQDMGTPPEALRVLRESRVGVRLPNLRNVRDAENVAKATTTIEALILRGFSIPPEALRQGISLARWPGRFESCPTRPRLWWDGAHNGQGIRHLGELWKRRRKKLPGGIVLAVSRDKDLPSLLTELRWAFRSTALIVTRSRNERAADPRVVAEEASRQGYVVQIAPDVPTAVERALEASGEEEVLLTGSLFAVGEAMAAFGGAPGEQL